MIWLTNNDSSRARTIIVVIEWCSEDFAMVKENQLSSLRDEIDKIDDMLLNLLSERAALTQEVGRLKKDSGSEVEYYRPDREAKIMRRLKGANKGPLTDESLVHLMREVISACLSCEKALSVAYLGPEGTYTHGAMRKHFGSFPEGVPCHEISQVFRHVEGGISDYGVVPIENSVGGSVNQTLDSLSAGNVKIIGEVTIPIKHQLLSKGKDLSQITKVFAHEQALMQCSSWLRENLGSVELIRTSSNAVAATKAKGDSQVAAIAGAEAAKIYGLEVLAKNIEDSVRNSTRFIVLGREVPNTSGSDRTSIMFSASDEAGSLYGVLGILANADISMSRIESKPSGEGLWDYTFFVDFLGHFYDPVVSEAISKMKTKCRIFKVLGSYPISVN